MPRASATRARSAVGHLPLERDLFGLRAGDVCRILQEIVQNLNNLALALWHALSYDQRCSRQCNRRYRSAERPQRSAADLDEERPQRSESAAPRSPQFSGAAILSGVFLRWG